MLFSAHEFEQLVEFAVDGCGRENPPAGVFGKQIRVSLQNTSESRVAVGLEPLPQRLQRIFERGEVETQGHIAVSVRRGPIPDVQPAEEFLEPFRTSSVVVVLQHGHPTGLAEPARTDQERVALAFQFVQEARLVDVEGPLAPHQREVGPAVGDWRDGGCHAVRWIALTSHGNGPYAVQLAAYLRSPLRARTELLGVCDRFLASGDERHTTPTLS